MAAVVSANEAARRFDLSEKTVRRWISAGKLKADKRGRAYRVVLSEVAALAGHDTTHDGGPSADTVRTADNHSAPSTADSGCAMSGITELVALVDRLEIENRELAAAAAVWQERARVLGEQLALAAPPDGPQRPQEAHTAALDPTVELPAPWWRSWWPRWLSAVVAALVGLAGATAMLTVAR